MLPGGRVGTVWVRLNSSFWFVPALMTVSSLVLFVLTLWLDQALDTTFATVPLIFSGGAHAARALLGTIAGSLITVVATVFSLTIVALQLASSSYSPRVLRNFTSDRGVQVVLGTYIATFTYALMVLRIIRTPESPSPETFVPVFSITVAVLLALICVGLLIYFIHHIATIIQSSTIVSRAHHDATVSLEALGDLVGTPEKSGEDLDDHPQLEWLLSEEPLVVRAQVSGYVQYLDVDALLEAVAHQGGEEEKMVVEIPFGPGSFVSAGLPMVRLWPAPGGGPAPDREEDVREAFSFGEERSFRQDFAFGLRQLSDIALKGISPGVNDPTTSMQAIDRMEAILIALGEKAMPPRVQEREVKGYSVLLKVGYYDFEDVVGLAFDQLRRSSFTSGQVAVLERLLEVIKRALKANDLPERQEALWKRAFAVGRLAPEHVPDPRDAVMLVLRTVEVGALLLNTESGTAVGSDLEELAELSADLEGGQQVREAIDNAWES